MTFPFSAPARLAKTLCTFLPQGVVAGVGEQKLESLGPGFGGSSNLRRDSFSV